MSSHAEQQGARINELNNGIVQQGVAEKYLQKAVVMLPSGNVQNFFVHKKSKGNVLTDLVSEHEGLLEKDYFGLNYVDNYGEKTWLYPNKRIAKQLKSVPWNFTLRVKFYAPEPSVLADDLTRYLLYLQIRKDVYDEVLPTSYPTKILLAGIVMQVEIGDFETSEQSAKEYDLFVRNACLVHSVDQEFLAKVREAHKEQKGLTTQEAHLKYLDAAKVLAKYGYTFFQGKDVKNANVTIGIHAHGISVYKDQVQIHKFWWQSIEKIQYSSNKFSILLKPGELDEKKQVTVRFSLPDYYTAKRLYRTAVEHHTFFRLIRPEDSPKNGLLSRVSSERFRYQGRTYFQAKMASQMFDNPTTTVQRTPSGRQVSRSVDDLAVQRSFSPLHYADESTHQATSPEKSKSYSLTTKNKDKRTPLSVVVHETQETPLGSKRSSTSSASIVSPFSSEYIVSSKPYTFRDEATTSPYEDVVFPLAKSLSENQRKQTITKSSASTSQRHSRVRFFEGTGPITPNDGSAVAMAPAIKPGKRTAKRRLFGPVNDDHTAFSPVDNLNPSPKLINMPLDSRVSVYNCGWYTATLPSTSSTQQNVPFFVCCKPTKAVRHEYNSLCDFDNGIICQSKLYKRNDLDSYPLRYYSSVYHSGFPPTKSKKWAVSKDDDVIPANRLNPKYYAFKTERSYSSERFEPIREIESVPLRQVSRVYWHGGFRKPNTNVVEVTPQSRFVQTISTLKKAIPSSLTNVERSFTEHGLPVDEVKNTTVEHSGQSDDACTITTTRIKTPVIFEPEAEPSTSKTYISPLHTKSVVEESVSSGGHSPVTETCAGPFDVVSKSCELELLPIKRFANVYHPGVSEEKVTPITWIRKQKTILIDCRRDSNRPTTSKTSKSSLLSKSAHYEKLTKKRLHSLSQHYPVIGEVYESPLKTLSPTTEAQSADLFDCVSFSSIDELKSSDITEVQFQNVKQIKKVKDAPTKKPMDQKSCTTDIHKKRWLHEFHTYKNIEKCKLSIDTNKSNDITHTENAFKVSAPHVTVTSENQLYESHQNQSTNPFSTQEQPIRVIDYELSRTNSGKSQVDTEVFIVDQPQSARNTEEVYATQKPVPSANAVYSLITLWCGKRNNAIDEPYTSTHQLYQNKSIANSEKRYSLSQNYPVIGESFEGDCVTLSHQPEAKSVDLFDTISFASSSGDSGVAGDTVIQRSKSKKRGLNCLWCGKRNNAIDEPYNRTHQLCHNESITNSEKCYSLSQNYPVIGESFEGDCVTLSHQPEAKSVDLFDTISFASSSGDSGVAGDTVIQRSKSKKRGLNCLWCTPSKSQRKTSKESFKLVSIHEQQMQRNRFVHKARTYSTSEHYPTAQVPHKFEVFEISKAVEIPDVNLFDTISFASSSGDSGVAGDTVIQRSKSKKRGLNCLWCGKRNNAFDEPYNRTHQLCHNESITNSEKCYSLSQNYPVIGESFEGDCVTLSHQPEAKSVDLFDTISFASSSGDSGVAGDTVIQRSKSKKRGLNCLWCGKRNNAIDEPYNRTHQLCHNESITNSEKCYSLSQNYPVIGESFEGDCVTLSHQPEAKSVDLFDTISFASSSGDSGVAGDTAIQRSKSKKRGLNCLWCTPSKSQRKTSKESFKLVSIHEQQMQRNRFVHKARTYSTSEHYPTAQVPHKFEVFEISKAVEIPAINLFDAISFASSTDDKQTNTEVVHKQKIPKCGLFCTSCLERPATLPEPDDNSETLEIRREVPFVSKVKYGERPITPIAVSVPMSKQEIVVESPTLRPIKKVVDRVEMKTVQRFNKPSSNAACSVLTEPYDGSFPDLPKDYIAAGGILIEHVDFQQKTDDIANATTSHKIEESLVAARFPNPPTKRQVEADKGCDLRCGKRNNAIDEPYNRTHQLCHNESITNSEKRYLLSRNYPVIGESFEGDCVTLSHQPEAKSVDLFDTISFASSSGDSGVAGDTAIQRSKSKKRGLNCLWCTPSKSQRKTSKESFKLVSIHEQQMQRNRFVHKARTYSTSEHYPTAQVPHKFEVFEISKAVEIPDVNLFDTISFASSSGDSDVSGDTASQRSKSKKRGLNCLCCGKRNNAIDEPYNRTHQLCHNESITNSEKRYSLSQNYPVIGESFEGDCVTLSHQPEAKSVDLFDTISFASSSGDSGVAGDTAIQRSKSKKRGLNCLWCGKRNNAIDEPYNRTHQLCHNESITNSEKRYSLSQNYPVIGESFEGDCATLSHQPEAKSVDLFDTISFASSSGDSGVAGDTAIQRSKSKKRGLNCLWCGKRNNAIDEPYNRTHQLCHNESITNSEKRYSLSRNYPVIGESFEGDCVTLSHQPEAKSVDLFDTISFASSSGDSDVSGDTASQRSKSKKRGLNCLWCGKRNNAIDEPYNRTHQLCHNESITNSEKRYSLSQNYPVIGESFEGDCVTLSHQPEAKSVDLFDTISFASSSGDSGVAGDTVIQRSKSKKRGLNCLWCTPSKSQRKTSKESFKLVSIHEQQMQRNRFVHKARTYSTSEHYPTAQVPHKFEVFEISKAVEIPAINLFDAISFASSTDDKQTNTEVVHKQKIPKCGLFCTSCLERPATLPEVDESYETIDFRREVPFVPTVKFGKRPISLVEGSVLMPTQDSHHPSGPHNVCNVSQSNGLPVCALSSMDTVFLPDHAKRSVPSRRGGKVPFSTFKRKYFKTRHAASVDGDCSSQSADELSKSSLKQKRTESEGFLSFFGSRFSPLTSTKTGFEGLMTIDDTNVKAIVLEANLSNTSIRDYVHVYHHGYSNVHQTIDSGFEDGLNTSETEVKCKDTLTMKKSKSFFEDLKRGIKRLSVDEQIKPESVVEVLTPSTPVQCEPFNRTLYSELHSSTKSAADLDSATLSTVVDEIPSGSYCRDMSKPVDFVVPTQKPVEHEQFLTLTKPTLTKLFSEESKQKRDLSYAYGMSFANSESDHNQVFKKSDVLKHPFCESASVNHLDKSDVLITQMPADFFEVSPERTISTQHPNSALTSEFESFAETNVPLEGSSVLGCQQVVITDSDQTETPKTSYSFNKNASEVILTSTPLADKVSTEPLQEQTVVHCSRRSNNRDVSKRKTRVAEASKDCNRRGVAQRFIAVFQKNSKLLEGYPEISLLCAYRGPLADFIRSKDLDQHYLHSFTNVYHSGFSDDKPSRKAQKILKKERQRALKNLKVDLNDYPHDDKAVSDAHIFNLHFIHDASQSPTPVTIPVDTFYHCRSHPRHRFLQRLCRNRQSRTSETAVTFYDALSRRDDYSTDTFSMVVSDKSLFTLGHWPVTDIDVDVVLTKQRRIDCEFETTVNTKCAYNSAIAGRTALSHVNVSLESGTVSSANCCRIHQHPEGFWYAEVSATLTVPQQQEEAVDDAIEVSRGTVVITEEPSFDYDLSHLVDDEVMSKSWVGNTSDYGLSSQIGDSLTRLSLASDDNDNIMFSAITRDLSEKLSKKSKKEEEKRRKKEDKEAAKRSKKNKKPSGDGTIKKPSSGGGDADSVSSTSSSSESPTEHKKHHVAVGQAVAGPVEPLSTNQELVVLHGIPERHQITMAPQTAAVNHIDDNSSGPYTPAKNNDGRVLREETIEQVYRISGNGKVPKFDLTDMSLQAAVDNYVRETDKVPRIEMVEANILVRENEPLPQALREGSAPHTTVHTWYETEADPEQVTTEIDKYGNKVTRTVKTQHTKHTIQKQSYQTYAVDGSFLPEQQTVIETTEETSPLGSDAVARSPVVHTKTRTVAYEKDSQNELTEPLGDFVSSKTITTGNRTVEILTYKTEKDGVVETRVEHRVTIHSGTDIDHDAELVTALLEATQMSPDLLINRVEVEKSAQS